MACKLVITIKEYFQTIPATTMANIGWIDFSTNDRRKVTQLLTLLQPEGQLDELGIGRIRDGLSDKLFPGISTIQTRAKYFFIISYILRDFYHNSLKSKSKISIALYLEEREHEVKNKLKDIYGGQTGTGVIGITLAKEKKIVRSPSEIYWVGLQTFGFIDSEGLSISSFLRRMQYKTEANLATISQIDKDKENDDYDAGVTFTDPIKVPVCPNWMETLSIELTHEESDFFYSSLINSNNDNLSGSILRALFQNPALIDQFRKADSFRDFARSVAAFESISPSVTLAHDFSQVIEGAHLLYNHMLQKRFYEAIYDNSFLEKFELWHTGLRGAMIDSSAFNPAQLSPWMGPASYFVTNWWNIVSSTEQLDENKMALLQSEVTNQEFRAKRKKSRLRGTLQSNIDLAPNKRVGLKMLDYRFQNVKRIIEDILKNKDA